MNILTQQPKKFECADLITVNERDHVKMCRCFPCKIIYYVSYMLGMIVNII